MSNLVILDDYRRQREDLQRARQPLYVSSLSTTDSTRIERIRENVSRIDTLFKALRHGKESK